MSFGFSLGTRTYYYMCNNCEVILTVESIHFFPENWVDSNETDFFKKEVVETNYQKYGLYYSRETYPRDASPINDSYHFCSDCIRREEIRQVFK